jgi:hypothetical protein
MSNPQKTLLERIEASVEALNGFGGGDTWRAEPLKASLEGAWCIKRGTYGMADQLADVFAQVNFGEGDRQDAEGVAKAMVEARNTSRHILTESAAEITRLQAEVERLTKVKDQAIDLGDFEPLEDDCYREPQGIYRPDIDKWGQKSDFPELYAELQSREGSGE